MVPNIHTKQHVVVVLGMHRSGTSALNHGLQILGVELGTSLIPEHSCNPKGFYEDLDIMSFNEELLNILDNHWDCLSQINTVAFAQERIKLLKFRAIELIRSKIQNNSIFGFKDPRTSKLLPFWKEVFTHLNLQVSYVIAVRNPLNVAQSLHARDQIEREKSYYLWLEHMLPAILETEGSNRIVVDFDILMSHPQLQLQRIARALNLKFAPLSSQVQEFIKEFLDPELKHHNRVLEDLYVDPAAPMDVIDAYKIFTDLAQDIADINDADIKKVFKQINTKLLSIAPAFSYITRLEKHLLAIKNQLYAMQTEKDAIIADKDAIIADKDAIILSFYQSSSWKITKPLRLLARIFRKCKKYLLHNKQ